MKATWVLSYSLSKLTNREGDVVDTNQHRRYVSPAEFLVMLDGCVSKNTLYAALHSREIPSIRIGKKFLIPADALDQMLEDRLNELAE